MSLAGQIAATSDEGEDVIGAGGGGSDSVENHGHNHHMSFESHALDDAVAGDDAVYASAAHDMVVHRADGSSQLTLSFRGQVYVFDSVTPDKVRLFLSRFSSGFTLTARSNFGYSILFYNVGENEIQVMD